MQAGAEEASGAELPAEAGKRDLARRPPLRDVHEDRARSPQRRSRQRGGRQGRQRAAIHRGPEEGADRYVSGT